MKNKYILGETVEINDSLKKTKIIDFEIFDDLILYYTEDKNAYPEHMLKLYGSNFISNFFKLSNHEKNKQVNEMFDNIFKCYK